MYISSAVIVAVPSVGISMINGPAAIANKLRGDVIKANGDQVFVTNSRFRI
jgi:hypothetical protein